MTRLVEDLMRLSILTNPKIGDLCANIFPTG